MNLPFTCLGLPIGGNPTKLSFWEPVLGKLRKKLSKWNNKCPSFVGHVCLIKFVLNVIKVLVGIFNLITKLQRNFLWS